LSNRRDPNRKKETDRKKAITMRFLSDIFDCLISVDEGPMRLAGMMKVHRNLKVKIGTQSDHF
jgi:hypothetical protein